MEKSKQQLDSRTAHRHAGLCAPFLWQDEAGEGRGDPASVDYTSIIGTLPEKVNGSPVFLVHVDGTADSGFGYSYQVERDVKVSLRENGEPLVSDATDEEVAQAEQHERDKWCKEYADLMHLVHAGAYSESAFDGSYCYEDTNISERIDELESAALEHGLHVAPAQDGTSYILEPATQEEVDAYKKAKEEAEEDEEEE